MQAYIWAVCGAVIISALAAILLPEGKIGKFINGILKLFCLAVMLTPLFGLFGQFNGDFLPDGGDSSQSELDDSFIEYMFGRRAEEEADALEDLLEEEFAVGVSTEILWDYAEYAYNVTEVNIKIENFGMYGNDEHILVIGRIESRTQELLPEAEVNVYE